MLRRLNAIIRFRPILRFRKDDRGVAAVEFALVAPILILAYLGMAELTLGLMAARRTEHLGSTVGDLASQSDNLTTANITDLFAIGASMLQPFSTTTGLRMRITEVEMNNANLAIVQWSNASSNWTKLTPGNAVTQILTSQITSGQYLIMTEVQYDYVSPIGNFLPGTTHFANTFYHHPRNGTQVTNIG